jgi:hypothetical protein
MREAYDTKDGMSQEEAELAAKDLETMMAASDFSSGWQAFAEQLSADPQLLKQLEKMMGDPNLQKQAALVQEQMEALKAEQPSKATKPSLLEVSEHSATQPKVAPKYRALAALLLAASAADAFQLGASASRGHLAMGNSNFVSRGVAPQASVTASEAAAKAKWLASRDATPSWLGTGAIDDFSFVSHGVATQASEEAAKAKWLESRDSTPSWLGKGATDDSEEAAKAAWLASLDSTPAWVGKGPAVQAATVAAFQALDEGQATRDSEEAAHAGGLLRELRDSEEAAKAKWLASLDSESSWAGKGATSEEAAKAAWLASRDSTPSWLGKGTPPQAATAFDAAPQSDSNEGAPATAFDAAPLSDATRDPEPEVAYDPWSDDASTVVTFMVDGVPKRYRIKQ